MHKYFLSIAFAVLGIVAAVAPVSSFAYIDPATAFGNTAPPTQREGDEVVRMREEARNQALAEERAKLTPVDAEPVDTYTPDTSTPSEPRGLLDEAATYERRQERIAEEKSSGPTIIIGGDSTVRDANGNVLHSGAPRVTSTGPESVLAVAAMLLAVVTTFGYAHIRTRRLATLA